MHPVPKRALGGSPFSVPELCKPGDDREDAGLGPTRPGPTNSAGSPRSYGDKEIQGTWPRDMLQEGACSQAPL